VDDEDDNQKGTISPCAAWAGLFVLILLVAYWEGARPYFSIVRYSTPQGFCQFDKTNKVDAGYLDAASNFARVGGFALVAAFADCRELEEARKSGAFIPTRIAILRWLKIADDPPPQFMSEACDQARKSSFSEEQKALMSHYIAEFSSGKGSLKNILPLGVLDEVRGTVCYDAILMKGGTAGNGDVTLLDLSAMTTLGNQPIAIHQFSSYHDERSVASALASLKTIYSDFAALNGKAD
jgi:hypothetical protein